MKGKWVKMMDLWYVGFIASNLKLGDHKIVKNEPKIMKFCPDILLKLDFSWYKFHNFWSNISQIFWKIQKTFFRIFLLNI